MNKFINVKLYSDVESYLVYNIKGKKAKAIHVMKNDENEIVPFGPVFDIEERNGIWGFIQKKLILSLVDRDLTETGIHTMEQGVIEGVVDKTDTGYALYEKTKSGRIKKCFLKLGTLEDECKYYFDEQF